jgi:acyl-CoA dehydrogenase
MGISPLVQYKIGEEIIMFLLMLLLLFIIIGVIGYSRLPLSKAIWPMAGWLLLTPLTGTLHGGMWFFWLPMLLALIFMNAHSLRRQLVSRHIMTLLTKNLPPVSKTEQEALDGGDVWWDAELFSGKPDWSRLYDLSANHLSQAEIDFLGNQTETLCAMLDDWQITYELKDLPEEVWDFILKERFFGMIIPEEYGGLGFSAQGHSEVIMKVGSRSITAAVTIMVPNSLGPGQLLLNYGTQEQKDYYLPRLASGREIPCFALTGPEAGSDASSIPDVGIICHQDYNGEADVLGIRVSWEKRYITLGPIATLLGLAFHAYDPDHILSDEEDVGITLALIPTDTPGVVIGNRHYPLDIPFQNGPNSGKDVFIPMEWVIGGQDEVGRGWRMLVECLGEGRGISLPSLSTASAKMATRITGAYTRVRKQFNLPIGYFEGIEEAMARIIGNTYIMDAGRLLTLTALDQGKKPAVITALLKYQLTERMRSVINDAMDIQGGSGICLGPSNFIGRAYQSIPIGITVEGANILTRTLIVFGQGALRCHPYLLTEMQTAQNKDLRGFDNALLAHMGFIISNSVRSIWLGLTNAIFVVCGTPATRKYCRSLTRLSSNFALISDYALLMLGGKLKRKERLSGRMADILANLYLCSAVIRHYEEQGAPKADRILVDYACKLTIHRAQQSMLAAFHNMPLPWLAKILRALMFPFGKPYSPPNDALIHQVAQLALKPSATRDRLTEGIFITNDPDDKTGRVEYAFQEALKAEEAEKQFNRLRKQGKLHGFTQPQRIENALRDKLISETDAKLLSNAWKAMRNAISVDEFTPEEIHCR